MESRYGKTEDEDDNVYRDSYMIGEDPERDEDIIEAEATDLFRSMMRRFYKAVAQNPSFIVKSLELRNLVWKMCSA